MQTAEIIRSQLENKHFTFVLFLLIHCIFQKKATYVQEVLVFIKLISSFTTCHIFCLLDDETDLRTRFVEFDQSEELRQQMYIAKEKIKGAHYVSPYRGLERILDPQYWLEDDEIDRASRMIKKERNDIYGLEDVCVTSAGQGSKCSGNFIQILHSHGHHWVTATTIGCDSGVIKVFDSMYRHFDRDCMKQVIAMAPVKESSNITIELAQFQRQKTKAECGLFAIAAAFSIAKGNDPSDDRYDLEKMRTHLYKCLDEKSLEQFPAYPGPITSQRKKVYSVSVCCQCKDLLNLSSDETAWRCENCGQFCHAPRENSLSSCSADVQDMKLCRKCFNSFQSVI